MPVNFGGKIDIGNSLREDCQFLENAVVGEEGNIPSTVATLRSVLIIFRHGDRSTLYGDFVGPQTDCTPFRDSDRCAFADYASLVNSEFFNTFLVPDGNLTHFSRVPDASLCTRGNLTAEGALQLLKLGNFLRERYEEAGFFEAKGLHWNLQVYSSLFARTFQSAIAFLSTFIYPLNRIFSKVYVNMSENQQFCIDELCKCRNLRQMEKIYAQTRTTFFKTVFGNRTIENFRRILAVLQITNLKDPLHFLDVVRGRYLCRRLPLPCHNNNCIKYTDIKEINSLVSVRDHMMFNDYTEGPSLFRRLMIAQSVGILYSVQANIETLLSSPNGSRYVHIYSGHDVTLRPLLFVLGIDHIEPPYYSARLVIEIYHRNGFKLPNPNLYFRILYNGEDRTNQLPFCTKNLFNGNLCSVDYLIYFINFQLLKMANVTKLDEICNMQL